MLLALLLGACQGAVLNPAGEIARQQRNLIFESTALMLIIIVPVMALTVLFAWRYRASNRKARYDPHFDHSVPLELLIWAAPLMIIICLGALTWSSTHLLDPFRPIDKVAGKPVDPRAPPLRVQVVALDWKWLFIYPEQGIATVNELALPVGRPIRFDITSTNMMNAFYAPTMAGMIYAMPGMQSQLHAVLDRPVESEGYSSNYSGAGFSDMRFRVHGLPPAAFDQWVGQVRASGRSLATADYLALEKPSEKVPPLRFAAVQPGLFDRIVNRCAAPGVPCMAMVMAHDRPDRGVMPPTHDALPPRGGKAKGALLKRPEEIQPAPNVTTPGQQQDAPGATKPNAPGNRNLSERTVSASPANPRSVRA